MRIWTLCWTVQMVTSEACGSTHHSCWVIIDITTEVKARMSCRKGPGYEVNYSAIKTDHFTSGNLYGTSCSIETFFHASYLVALFLCAYFSREVFIYLCQGPNVLWLQLALRQSRPLSSKFAYDCHISPPCGDTEVMKLQLPSAYLPW